MDSVGPASEPTPVYQKSHASLYVQSKNQHRILSNSERILKMPGVAVTNQPIGCLSDTDMVFGFFEEDEAIPGSFTGVTSPESEDSYEDQEESEEQEKENHDIVEDDRKFWETQHQVLQSTLFRSSSLESKIRNATNEALNEIQMAGNVCACGKPVSVGACRSCLMREVSSRLRSAGYNSAICKSKWRSSPHIPSGEHTFMDVIYHSSSKTGEVRVIIELNFRAEFEMARASEQYNKIVSRLPEVFVGKLERLTNVIKMLCTAAKKSVKEKKMHMGPWRKQRYMQAKWLSPCERITPSIQNLPMGHNSGRLPKPKPRASMLTVDLLEKLPNIRCTTVEVL